MKSKKILSIVLSLITAIVPFLNGAFEITIPFNVGYIQGVPAQKLSFVHSNWVGKEDAGTIGLSIFIYGIAIIFLLIGIIKVIQNNNYSLLFTSQALIVIYMVINIVLHTGTMKYLGESSGNKEITIVGWMFLAISIVSTIMCLISAISSSKDNSK